MITEVERLLKADQRSIAWLAQMTDMGQRRLLYSVRQRRRVFYDVAERAAYVLGVEPGDIVGNDGRWREAETVEAIEP